MTGDALLVGRLTFEAFRSYWPQQTDDEAGVNDCLNRVESTSSSRRSRRPGRGRVRRSCAATSSTRCRHSRGAGRRHRDHLQHHVGARAQADGTRRRVSALRVSGGVVPGSRFCAQPVDQRRLELVEAHAFGSGSSCCDTALIGHRSGRFQLLDDPVVLLDSHRRRVHRAATATTNLPTKRCVESAKRHPDQRSVSQFDCRTRTSPGRAERVPCRLCRRRRDRRRVRCRHRPR